MSIIFWLIIFIISMIILIKSSDYFTDSAEKIGIAFRISPFIVGVTIVAIGTSLPELISSIVAVISGHTEIVVSNVIGSNIANILLVIGITAILAKKIIIKHELMKIDLPILCAVSLIFTIMIIDGNFGIFDGIISLIGLAIYIGYAITSDKDIINEDTKNKKIKITKPLIVLLISGLFLYLGAKYTIDSVVQISSIIGIGKEIIAVTAIAIGTSLPELAVSINAVKKGKNDLAIGNIIGSNIFNIFMVMGIPALIGTLIIPKIMITLGLPIMLIATFLLVIMSFDKEISIWEGLMLLLVYILFISKLFF
jgi:cation:H+ antiporter